jgi:hypothetical protein
MSAQGLPRVCSDTLYVQFLPITVRLNRQQSTQGPILTLSWIGGAGPLSSSEGHELDAG